MRIAIISDSHGNAANLKKVAAWLKIEKIKIILHCGDIGSPESLEESLENFNGKLLGVIGNVDKNYRIPTADYNKIKNAEISEDVLETKIADKKIAVVHFPDKAMELAESGDFDLVFYGHTHRPWEDKIRNCRVINPGELAGQIFKPTFAVYDTQVDLLELKILEKI